MSKYTKIARSICDLLLFAALNVCIFMLHRVLQRQKRGFFCGDDSLGFPFRESTIGLAMLLSCTLGIPSAVIIVVELFKQLGRGGQQHLADKSNQRANGSSSSSTDSCSCGCRIGHRLLQCYKQLGYFLFGLGLTVFTMQLTKYSVGRLRPHFMSVCQPVLPDGSTCADAHNHGKYIDTYNCANANTTDFMIKQLTQSFPSGHACLIFYAMTYLAIYLQAVLSTRLSKLLKHLLQFVFLMFAWYVSLTRIADYWHHWTDVLAGIVLGAGYALLVSVYVADLFAFKRFSRGGANANGFFKSSQAKHQVSPKNSGASKASTALAVAASNGVPPPLPAYTFGTLPYLTAHPAQAQYAQTYHNYGYVP